MEDVTRRLRMSDDGDDVARERKLACDLFQIAMRESDMTASPEAMRRLAKRSVEAACIFWEEWEIAALTPEIK